MMNVTSSGYYTTQYLNKQQRQSSHYRDDDIYQIPRTPHEHFQSTSAPKSNRRSPVMRNIRPKPQSSTSSPQSQQPSTRNLSNSKPQIDVEIDPEDQLEEEITPAELKHLQEDNIITEPIEVTAKPQQEQKLRHILQRNKNDNYYLKQKQRYDEAEEVKPKMYTHKTFREVFTDKQENQSRYNPMDSVFEQSDDLTASSKTNAKLSAFLKNIKVIKDDYNDYNYYEHRKRKSPGRDIFVNEASDNDDYEEDVLEEQGEQQEGSQADGKGKSKMKKNTLKSFWKKKINRAKRELGRDFDSHINGNRGEEEDMYPASTESNSGEILETESKDNNAIVHTGNEFALASMVSSSYNYLWSWYDFYQNRRNQKEQTPCEQSNSKAIIPMAKMLFSLEDASGTDSSANKSTQKPRGQKRAKFANGSRQLLTGWNQPANRMFRNETSTRRGHRIIYPIKDNASSTTTPSSEFIVEYDSSDEDSMTAELYYNPQTKQLEAEPPTSSQSMMTVNSNNDKSSLAIVSNLLNLIKQIHIMQLIYTPIDFIGEYFPQLQTIIVVLELVLFVWILYELSRLVDALCMMVRAFCSPMIAVGRFMNKIM
ncbi:hypothetical protein CANMA_002553 [Candida margitis]|uniref:uncharacterized protein n=1 Tax=Candida margitis TaxID=1775924 RepID=UPI0022280E23|nr:uncharacterized protein CANMA_002553 [Candida margitis]KAI5968337.1 hypothetical protein CANMA_002553 [Candida margitis]